MSYKALLAILSLIFLGVSGALTATRIYAEEAKEAESVTEASTATPRSPSDGWGERKGGLRCRWMEPSLQITTAYPPVLILEVQNASDYPVRWNGFCAVQVTPNKGPRPGSMLLPEGVSVIVGPKARVMTASEVGKHFGPRRPHKQGPDAPMKGYYHFDPDGRVALVIPLPWSFRDRFPPGKYQVRAEVHLHPQSSIGYGPEGRIDCVPLIVHVEEAK